MDKAPASQSVLIDIRDARVRIGRRRSLFIERFRLQAGRHCCVFGANGAGKSLLAAMLRDELVGARRHVEFGDGFDVSRDCMTVSFEEQQRLWSLDNRHDISEYAAQARDEGTTVAMLLGLSTGGLDTAAGWQARVLDTLAMRPLLDKGIRYLSSGQVRRALIARALLGKSGAGTRLLIMDDPLESIDRGARESIQGLLSDWMSPENCLVLLCRRRSEILPGLNNLVIMEDLKIIAQGEAAELMTTETFRRIADPESDSSIEIPHRAGTVQSATAPLISLHRVDAGYGEKMVLNQVSWTLNPGQHCLVEGPNGCGKSTLLSLINGENHKAYGQAVYLFGRRRGSGETVWDIKARFGVVSNEIHNRYVRGWKVIDVVLSGYFDSVGLYDDSGSSQIEAAEDWLCSLGMAGLSRHGFHEISFGQQRLVLLARAMVKLPAILILDEPCVGLDDHFRRNVLGIVDRIAACSATQIIYVTHTPGEAPDCINQWLRFVPDAQSGYRVEVS